MAKIKRLFIWVTNVRPAGFWTGFVIGFFYFGYIFWWFWSLYPLDSLGIHNKPAAAALVALVYCLSVSAMALFWGLFGLFTLRLINKNIPLPTLPPILAGTFVLAEFLRAIFFSVIFYGTGGMIGPHWSLGNLAYWFVDAGPVAVTASLWGIYGIDFILILIITSIITFLITKRSRRFILMELLSGLLIIIAGALIANYINGRVEGLAPLPAAIIQTDIPSAGFITQSESLEDLRQKISLLDMAVSQIGEGIIVFPEGTNLTKSLVQILGTEEMTRYFNKISEDEVLIVDSLRTMEGENFTSKAIYISSRDGIIGSYDKQVLTPFGEFLPYLLKAFMLIINPTLLDDFESYREYTPGYGSNIINYKDLTIKSLVCSELISPFKSTRGNADFMVLMGSFSIWNGDPLAVSQARTMARFRAIENGKYMIFASNSGGSYILDTAGKVTKSTVPDSYELLTGSIIPNKSQTWYNYLGDWPILLLSSVLFALGLKQLRNDQAN